LAESEGHHFTQIPSDLEVSRARSERLAEFWHHTTSAVPPPTSRGRSGFSALVPASPSSVDRNVTSSAPSCSALHRPGRRLLRPRLTPAHPSRRLSTPLASRQTGRSPRVRRVTFAPYTRRIYARPVRVASGFGSLCPLAHPPDASYAVRLPRAGALPPAAFPRHLAVTQLLFG
jgi:hypothetical protein